MNIIYHHRTQGSGVEGVHIREMVNAWKKQGHTVDMVEPSGVSACDEQTRPEKENKSIYTVITKYLPELVFEIFELMYNFMAAGKLKKSLKKKEYDYLYERYALFNWSGVKAAKRANVPAILEVNYTAHTPLYRKRSSLLKPLVQFVEKWVFNNAAGIVVVSTYLKAHMVSLGIEEGKIIVLPNAADPEKFSPSQSSSTVKNKFGINEEKVIGFVGGFYPWHGLDLLLNVFDELSRKHDNIVLLLIGDGPMRSSLEEKIIEMKIESRVHFAGKISSNNLPEYIAAFDIAVMPHSNVYGSPMKIFEYMAMEKAVVAPRFGPLEDGIDNGVNGYLFEPGNEVELFEAFDRLLMNDDLRMKVGAQGRKRVLNKHNWNYNAELVCKLAARLKKDVIDRRI